VLLFDSVDLWLSWLALLGAAHSVTGLQGSNHRERCLAT
jgi:hypothetical protein